MSVKTVLVVPDTHAMPGDDLDRLKQLMAWLVWRKIELTDVVHLGDLWDFGSLCTHDMDDPEWYHRSLEDDIQAGLDGLDLMQSIFEATGAKNFYFVEGNHEDRYNKWMKSDNRLLTSGFPKTVASLVKQRRPTFPVKYQPFLKPLILHGAVFQHYFVSGLMGRPQGGEHHANNLLKSQHTSCVCGHSHLLSTATRTKADGSKINALVGGCFVDPDGDFGYAKASKKMWWNGVHLLHFTGPGAFDVESVSIERLYNS